MALDLLLIVGVVIALALVFVFTNGFHDASSVVATVIACGAMSPRKAILLASVFTILGALLGGSAVIYTIQKEFIFVEPGEGLALILLTGLIGATVWNIVTWKYGMPSSSTHALVGGLLGSTLLAAGTGNIGWGFKELMEGTAISGMVKILVALLISPPIGLGLAYLLQKIVTFFLRNSERKVNNWLNRVQYATASVLAFSHGANDTQKHMGVIMLALLSANAVSSTEVPVWLRFVIGAIMMVGTLGGGWTIMRTLGRKIYPLEPVHSLNSQLASSTAVMVATLGGGPISTTHVVGSSVMGAGAGDEIKMVSWGVGRDMLLSWFITIPAAALVSAMIYYPIEWIIHML